MTDREEFEKWVKEGKDFYLRRNNFSEYITHTTRVQWVAWQARGELDAVRIKELEAEVKKWQTNSVDLEYKCLDKDLLIDELTAKLDKAKEALKWIDKVNAMDSEYVRVARQALVELDK